MRWVDFRALRDLLVLVSTHPDGLRAGELEQLATDERVLIRRDGRPYAKSTHYHHRRTLERLGLLAKEGRHLVLNLGDPGINALVESARLRQSLTSSEKEAFANAVLRDKDCHDAFFGSFLRTREPALAVTKFVEQANPVDIVVRSGGGPRGDTGGDRRCSGGDVSSRRVEIRPADCAEWSVLSGADAIQAIHFGLRSWCVDQLGFLDIVYRADGAYTVFPRHIVSQMTDQDLAGAMFGNLEFADDWATIRVPDFVLATGIRQRVSVEQVKGVLTMWLTSHPDLVAGVPTRVQFITAGLSDRQHVLALKGYLRSASGAYLSHVRIHKTLWQYVQTGDSIR